MRKKKWYGLIQKSYGLVHIADFDKKPSVEIYLQSVGGPYSCEIEDFSIVELKIEILKNHEN